MAPGGRFVRSLSGHVRPPVGQCPDMSDRRSGAQPSSGCARSAAGHVPDNPPSWSQFSLILHVFSRENASPKPRLLEKTQENCAAERIFLVFSRPRGPNFLDFTWFSRGNASPKPRLLEKTQENCVAECIFLVFSRPRGPPGGPRGPLFCLLPRFFV